MLSRLRMRAFLAINVYRGLVSIADTKAYWGKYTRVPWITETMSRDRFLQLSRVWSLVGRAGEGQAGKDAEAKDKWFRVRPLMDAVLAECKRAYHPSRWLTIDEQMIAFKGRHDATVHIGNKPHGDGWRVNMIVDAKTTRVVGFDPYKGKIGKKPEVGLAERVVMELAKPYLNKGYIIVCDNYFSSMSLVQSLLAKGTGYVGTVRRKRQGFPPGFFIEKRALKRGEHIVHQQGRTTAWAWGDNQVVFLVSSVHSPRDLGTAKRWVKGQGHIDVPAPRVLLDYQQYMRGVDRVDQRCESYMPGTKSRRWWVKMAWGIINIGIHNAYIMHRLQCEAKGKQPLTNFAFRLKLANELRAEYLNRAPASAVPAVAPVAAAVDCCIGWLAKRGHCQKCRKTKPAHACAKIKSGCITCGLTLCLKCYNVHQKKR